jgi:hypothetical protein
VPVTISNTVWKSGKESCIPRACIGTGFMIYVLKTPKLSKFRRVGLRLAFIAAFSAMHVLGPCSFWPPSTSVSSCSHDLPPCWTRCT